MKVYQFAYTLGLSALVSLAISIGVTDFMLNQRDKEKEVVAEEYISPEIKEMAERNKMLAEANVLIKQAELDAALSEYSGVIVEDAYKAGAIIDAKLHIEGGRTFCKTNGGSLKKVIFYKTSQPLFICTNGVYN